MPPQSAPAPPVVIPSGGGNAIVVNPSQRGNPVLEAIRNVAKEFGDIVADYQVGRTTGVLFLSLKYHRLHPEYIHTRIEKLGHSYNLRILLVISDVTEHRDPIRELTKMCLINNITVLVAFSVEEAGHYLATFKQFEHKPPDLIKERVDKDYDSILRSTLTSISKVNKTDVETLRTSFGSFANISRATSDQLQNLPGFGQVKVRNIKNAFEKPIRNNATTTLDMLTSQAKGKGKAREEEPPVASSSWDIERDLTPPAQSVVADARYSPPWDIQLDLN
ncbi:restriction endonuclease type II-like protein [Mycena albidolilacea]|uniref:Restriction endonuclease type II-like protein n=1 Tax=Mycena albidolilacea TaxID=1033008 RepID=A0AAD7A0T1_9AGAR|nr:restriction endonuclease type II-like protein [Mycena albidolilacea]